MSAHFWDSRPLLELRQAWLSGADRDALRSALMLAWDLGSGNVVEEFGRDGLRGLFRAAAFDVPFPGDQRLTVWRGTTTEHRGPKFAASGFSWTLSRDTAVAFAVQHGAHAIVLTAEISARDVAMFNDSNGEAEIVLLKAPADWRFERNGSDWQEAAARDRRRTEALLDERRRLHAKAKAAGAAVRERVVE